MILTAPALLESSNATEFKKNLYARLKFWFLTLSPGLGRTTLESCSKMLLGFGVNRCAVSSKGNAPLMLTPIISALYCQGKIKRNEYLEKSSTLTHTSSESLDSSLVLGNLIAYLLVNDSGPELENLTAVLIESISNIEIKNVVILIKKALENNLSDEDFINSIGSNARLGVSGYCSP